MYVIKPLPGMPQTPLAILLQDQGISLPRARHISIGFPFILNDHSEALSRILQVNGWNLQPVEVIRIKAKATFTFTEE
jgi:hypothetical protein